MEKCSLTTSSRAELYLTDAFAMQSHSNNEDFDAVDEEDEDV
jgi:hypothetical protein